MGWSKIRWAAAVLLAIAVSVGVAVALHKATATTRALDDAQKRAAISAADRADLRQKVDILTKQIEDLGEKPAVTQDDPVPPQLRYVPVPGPRGTDGKDGRDGDSVTGPPGESITGPAGKDGKDGAPGRDGADAPRVTGISCDGTTGVFSMSDGAEYRVKGMCAPDGPLSPIG